MATEITKTVGYVVLGPPNDVVSISNLVGYAVLRPEDTPPPPATPRVIQPVWIGL